MKMPGLPPIAALDASPVPVDEAQFQPPQPSLFADPRQGRQRRPLRFARKIQDAGEVAGQVNGQRPLAPGPRRPQDY